jgi:tetratricopeptide (TPR) repeat protein/tRNA A-37 threonylcarbamoyl transferase component Bud32
VEGTALPDHPRNPPDYEILSVLGEGGMGVVYKARQKSLNRLVALKMIRAGFHASAELLARFHVEAEALASLQHPNIVQVYEVGEHDGCPFMAMEFLDGGSLDDYLHPLPPPARAAELVETLARAMHAAHLRGIVHRDLKPANVLLQTQNAECRTQNQVPSDSSFCILNSAFCIPKITDFGLAKRLTEDKGRTTTGAIMGTPSYMAPEQARGHVHAIGPPTDVYALGAILYRMLTGKPPFQGETALETIRQVESEEPTAPTRLCRKLPHDLETICLKCLEKEPAKRYGTALDLADDLRRFLEGEPIAARPAHWTERAWKWIKRRPAQAALIGVSGAAALLLAILGITWSLQVRAERDRARHSLQVARKAIDDLYTKMASERLFDEPQLDPLCQELLQKAQTLYEDLAREHGGDTDLRRDNALVWFRLGQIHRLRDQHAEAQQAYDEAIARQEALSQENPREPHLRQELANSHNWLGELLRESGRPLAEAEEHYRTAQKLQKELVQQFQDEPLYRMELARSHYNLGIVQKNTNRLPEARANYDRAVELLTELHQADGRDPNGRQDLARALINRGVLLRLDQRPEEARQDYDRAIDLLTQLREEFPARAVYKFELAIARQDRGNLYWSKGRQADAQRQNQAALGLLPLFWSQSLKAAAQREHQEALVLLRGLVADFSSRPRYKKKMGNALKNFGAALATAGDLAGAEQCWNQARTLFEALTREFSQTADYHGLLGMTLGNLGWLRTEQKNWPEARRLIEEGIVQMRAALEPNPQHPDYREELRSQYQDLAWTLVQLGDHRAVAQAARDLASVFPERAQDNYNAACFFARCASLAPRNDPMVHSYVEEAVQFLRRGASLASPTLKRLPDEEKVFQPLASHPECATALQELNAKTRPANPPGGK